MTLLLQRREEGADFRVVGTSTESMLGACEAFYKPNLPPNELFEVACQSMVSALGRDALSGWGAVVHVLYASSIAATAMQRVPFFARTDSFHTCVCAHTHRSHEHGLKTRTIRTRMD